MIPLNLQIVALIASVVLGFATGWKVHGWKTDAEALETARAHVEQMKQAQRATDDLSAQLEAAKAQREVVTRTITKEVVKYAQNPDIGHCRLAPEFGVLFNSAAEGTAPPASEAPSTSGGTSDTSDSAVLAVATENFGQCKEWRASLIGWQEWYQSIR